MAKMATFTLHMFYCHQRDTHDELGGGNVAQLRRGGCVRKEMSKAKQRCMSESKGRRMRKEWWMAENC